MRIVALEEHINFPELTGRIPKELIAQKRIGQSHMNEKMAPKLADVSGERLQLMDESGISVQVLSAVGPGADLLSPEDAPAFAKDYNDLLAVKIAANPGRFAAFAHLPLTNPEAAAIELERAIKELGFKGGQVNGLTGDEFLDNPKFAPILKKAEELEVPIYLHPGLPPNAVFDAYYSDLPNSAGNILSIAGWGWHSETAIHILRLIVSGTMDKYANLKIIIGHMGEMLPVMMSRCDDRFKLGQVGAHRRLISQTLKDQVYITTSGIFTQPPLRAAIDTFGIDNIMFSVDYPYSTNKEGREFLDNMQLSPEETEKIAHGNADKLLKLPV